MVETVQKAIRMANIEKELKKVKFLLHWIRHEIGDLSETDTPISWLIEEMDWAEEDLHQAHDIFEKYDDILRNGEDVDWRYFEGELYTTLSVGQSSVKYLILAFFRSGKWERVCKQYTRARAFVGSEEILAVESV